VSSEIKKCLTSYTEEKARVILQRNRMLKYNIIYKTGAKEIQSTGYNRHLLLYKYTGSIEKTIFDTTESKEGSSVPHSLQ
jgi:hypothetical protein